MACCTNPISGQKWAFGGYCDYWMKVVASADPSNNKKVKDGMLQSYYYDHVYLCNPGNNKWQLVAAGSFLITNH